MVNINDEFPSKYLKAADLQGNVAKVQIGNVTSEQIGSDRKLIMYFAGKQKGMVLNKTNAPFLKCIRLTLSSSLSNANYIYAISFNLLYTLRLC